jgi:hypothetical protein
MRPRYETPYDRGQQRRAISAFCEAFRCEATATPELAAWDYDIVRDGRTVAVVEVKCRLCKHDTYPTYMIGLRKMERLREAASEEVAAILLVAWQDRMGFVHADTAISTGMKAHGGRTDRGDPLDTEVVLHVPIDRFRMV